MEPIKKRVRKPLTREQKDMKNLNARHIRQKRQVKEMRASMNQLTKMEYGLSIGNDLALEDEEKLNIIHQAFYVHFRCLRIKKTIRELSKKVEIAKQ